MTWKNLVEALGLEPHPEGGWFRETFRSTTEIVESALPAGFAGARCACTSILYLLADPARSRLHRLRSDEIWYFHAGTGLLVHEIDPSGRHRIHRLGPRPEAGDAFQAVVPAGSWFGAECEGGWALVGCAVAPGFDFADFELGKREDLLERYPEHEALVRRLTAPRAAGVG